MRTRLALRLEEAIKERAKANQHAGINQHSLPQNSAEPSRHIETREEIAKLAGVSRDTVEEEGHPGTVPECPAPAITARPMEGRDGGAV